MRPAPHPHDHPLQRRIGWGLLAAALPLLAGLGQPLWSGVIDAGLAARLHNTLESLTSVVALLIFVTAYRALSCTREAAVVLLGVAFLGVGLLNFLHVLGYTGLPPADGTHPPQASLFFWLDARLLAALALAAYLVLPASVGVSAVFRRQVLALTLALVGALAGWGFWLPEQLPVLFVAGRGASALYFELECLILCVNLLALAALWQRRHVLAKECVMALCFAVALSCVSELFFLAMGALGKDGAYLVGHGYKVAAYLYLFHATYSESVRRPLERMQAQHQREARVVSAAPDGVLWVDQGGQILLANPAMEVLSGYPAHELMGRNVDLFLPPSMRAQHGLAIRRYFAAPQSRAMGSMDLQLMRRDGRVLPIDISLGHWEDEGERFAIAYVRDLTERKKFEESLRHQATHDELTGLPNRWLLSLRLSHALTMATRSGLRVAVLFLDLDHFKAVNDGFGHAAGDALLIQVARRIGGALRENDTLARLGGDEFAILLGELGEVSEAVNVATKLLHAMKSPYPLQGQELYCGASVGLAFYPDDGGDAQTLLRYADMAMYQAKQAGRGAYACYSQEMDQRVHEDMRLHARLKDAIAQGGLMLHYQPQVDVVSGRVVGAEALLRWHDEVLGEVSPARFVPLAEATGLILPLSDWVLHTACAQIAAWARSGTPLRVAVNFSAQQFRQRQLCDQVREALQRAGAQARWLGIEITESVAMTQPEQATEQLQALMALGCTVSLDDFGTGYSSLAYLKTLPVSELKIDKSFMDGIPRDVNDVNISKAIIALAHSLGLNLVAEGVETLEQLAFLRAHGCNTYQGWLFAKAMPAQELTRLLGANPGLKP